MDFIPIKRFVPSMSTMSARRRSAGTWKSDATGDGDGWARGRPSPSPTDAAEETVVVIVLDNDGADLHHDSDVMGGGGDDQIHLWMGVWGRGCLLRVVVVVVAEAR